jgi:histone H3/H4
MPANKKTSGAAASGEEARAQHREEPDTATVAEAEAAPAPSVPAASRSDQAAKRGSRKGTRATSEKAVLAADETNAAESESEEEESEEEENESSDEQVEPSKKTKTRASRIRKMASKIKKQQANPSVIIPKAVYERIVRKYLQDLDPKHRIRPQAITVGRHAAEAYAMGLSWRVREFAQHAKRRTVQLKDVVLYSRVNPGEAIPESDLIAATKEDLAAALSTTKGKLPAEEESAA